MCSHTVARWIPNRLAIDSTLAPPSQRVRIAFTSFLVSGVRLRRLGCETTFGSDSGAVSDALASSSFVCCSSHLTKSNCFPDFQAHGAGVWCTRDCRFCFKRAIRCCPPNRKFLILTPYLRRAILKCYRFCGRHCKIASSGSLFTTTNNRILARNLVDPTPVNSPPSSRLSIVVS